MNRTATLLTLFLFFACSLTAQRASIPYYDNFETGATGWISSDDGQSGTSWELGIPTYGWTIGAYSGTHCWDVNLNTAYTSNAVCYLISPVFDFTNIPVAHISFWTKYHTEYLWDYLSVQYTLDNGDSWNYLPFPGLTNSDGYVSKWTKSALTINDFYGFPNVQLRFVFVSDASVVYDGYSIDDFRIEADELLGTPSVDAANVFSFYPNPSHGELNFDFTNTSDPDAVVSFYDVTGKMVRSQTAEELKTGTLLISELPKGTYSVVYSGNESVSVKKLIVRN